MPESAGLNGPNNGPKGHRNGHDPDLLLIRYETSARGRSSALEIGQFGGFALVGDVTGFVTALSLGPTIRVRSWDRKPLR